MNNSIEIASAELTRHLIAACGGLAAIANSLDYDRQHVYKWKKYGYVPLVQVYGLSKLLHIDQWALSYAKLYEVFGPEKSPSFASVVKKAPLSQRQKAVIMSYYKGDK